MNQNGHKVALVISDTAGLARAVEMLLHSIGSVQVKQKLLSKARAVHHSESSEGIALIVVAVSSLKIDPVLALVRAGVEGMIGSVPIIIAAEGQFDTHPDERIIQVGFPYDPEKLQAIAKTALNISTR